MTCSYCQTVHESFTTQNFTFPYNIWAVILPFFCSNSVHFLTAKGLCITSDVLKRRTSKKEKKKSLHCFQATPELFSRNHRAVTNVIVKVKITVCSLYPSNLIFQLSLIAPVHSDSVRKRRRSLHYSIQPCTHR